MVTIASDGRVRGPRLPAGVLPDGQDWHPRTQAWWSTWRKSPQAKTFIATDWDFLLDTAVMHHAMWTQGRFEIAGELRLRAAKFGATPEDRMRLRMEIDQPDAPKKKSAPESAAAPVTDLSSRRERLTG